MADLYIYYRVRDEDAASMAPRVRTMQARMASEHGVHGELKRRPGSASGQQTWMEIYPAAPDGFDTVLATAVADARLAEMTHGARHTEVFMDVASCA